LGCWLSNPFITGHPEGFANIIYCVVQNSGINLKDNHKGILTIEGIEPIKILKWEENFEKKGKVNIGLYFYSSDKKRFVKRSLRMYNSGRGFKLKAIYQTKDYLKVYNALSIQGGKIEHNDGRMELKR